VSGGGRFRYPLEPARLLREWALDEARQALAQQNALLAEAEATAGAAQARLADGCAQWAAISGNGQMLAAQQCLQHGRYLATLAVSAQSAGRALAERQEQHAGHVAQLASARRALDGLEKHRSELRRDFVRARLQAQARETDDLWGVLQAGRNNDGN
jgi:hypothetical protein